MAARPDGYDGPPSIGLECSLVVHFATRVAPQDIPTDEDPENWVEVQFQRPRPGAQDPEKRVVTAPMGVKADYIIYDHEGNEVKRGKYAREDGSPERVPLPPEVTNITVRFEHDEDKSYEIVHKPQAHGLKDNTKPPTSVQKARGGSVGIA